MPTRPAGRPSPALPDLDGLGLAALVRGGEVSPIELVDAAIARIEALDPQLGALVHHQFERARAEATGELPDGPLRGVPFLLKDLDASHEAGEPYHAGTRYLARHDYRADVDSELVRRFRAAGLVCVGRTKCPELGLQPTTEPLATGPARNPWSLDRSPGGSSGGSAAAVASGMVPLAHAGDGGGSIRIPASACGLVGLKPTRARHTNAPDGESWAGLVVRGVISRSVRDTAVALDAISGPAPGDPYTAPPPVRPFAGEVGAEPGALRVGWLTGGTVGVDATDPECVTAVEETLHLLEDLGHRVEDSRPRALADDSLVDRFIVGYAAWTAREVQRLEELAGEPVAEGDLEPGTVAIAEMGRAVSATDYLAAVEHLQAWTREVCAWWTDHDVLVLPTMPELPTRLGEFQDADPLAGMARSQPVVAFAAPFNVTGQPAVSLPLHWSEGGLPVGVQLVAATGREDLLLRVAAQLEQARPWEARRPPLA